MVSLSVKFVQLVVSWCFFNTTPLFRLPGYIVGDCTQPACLNPYIEGSPQVLIAEFPGFAWKLLSLVSRAQEFRGFSARFPFWCAWKDVWSKTTGSPFFSIRTQNVSRIRTWVSARFQTVTAVLGNRGTPFRGIKLSREKKITLRNGG